MKVLEAILICLVQLISVESELPEEMILVAEREFDAIAVNMVFGVNEAEESIYPKILVTPDKIRFMDEKGITLSEVVIPEKSSAVFSKEGHFVGIVEYPAKAGQKQAFALQEIKFGVFNERGKRLYQLKRAQEYEHPIPGFYISPKDGSVVLSDNPEGLLYFYDNKGELTRELDLFEADEYNDERNIACCFSSDGNYFVVNALKNYDTPREEGKSYVILFDNSGTEIWRKQLEEKISSGVEISISGDYIVACGYKVNDELAIESKSTFLLDKDGEVICRYSRLFRLVAFSSDGKYLALGERNRVWLVKTQTGEILWEKQFTRRVRGLDVSQSGLVLIETAGGKYEDGTFVFYSPEVTIITLTGHEIYEKEFTDSRFYSPGIKILDGGEGFGVGFADRFLFYK